MNTALNYFNKPGLGYLFGWLLAIMAIAACFPFIKNLLVMLLMKFYELFIQHNR